MNQVSQKNNLYKKANKNGQNTKVLIVFIVGFVLGLLVMPIITGDKSNQFFDKKIENKEKNTMLKNINSIIVNNQLAGDRVLLENITLSQSGWAAVHEDINGDLGNVLGAQRFNAGSNSGYVELLRNTETGNLYYIILYKDNGDGKFDLKTDTAFVNDFEEVILETFKTITFDRKTN